MTAFRIRACTWADAAALMHELLRWATERQFDRVLLHASTEGRPLYERLGFVPTNEMRWTP